MEADEVEKIEEYVPSMNDFAAVMMGIMKTLGVREVEITQNILIELKGSIAVYKDNINGNILVKLFDGNMMSNHIGTMHDNRDVN